MSALSDYDYELPPELLAKEPPPNREDARLMVVRRHDRTIAHHSIADLPELLTSGDCLVLNDTKVVPARLFGVRTETGGKWEGLFLEEPRAGEWKLIGETRGKLQPGESLTLHPIHDPESGRTVELRLTERTEGVWTARPNIDAPAVEILSEFGTLPLPPYIGRKVANENDRTRYQTTFAKNAGAIAAPTAGLHLTPSLLHQCETAGVDRQFVTLHVGIGTFRPVNTDNIDEHVMHSERCEIDSDTAASLNLVRASQGRVIAVGTTCVRTLESASSSGSLEAVTGETDIFIRPPYEFRSVDGLLTNFHLPKSTLLMLVAAFADLELLHEAYRVATAERYRFYSYGDAMLIL